MKKTFHQIRCPVILLLCFALVFQTELAAQANSQQTTKKVYVIDQTVGGETQYLLYDGHGSTRQMTDNSGQITDSFSYDGYGVLLQDETAASAHPGYTAAQATSLLYCGEYFDTDLQQYYLRARYYNPLNGLFNRIDPFSGNLNDPQSLHKYLYCHANPVNNTDPSGRFTIPSIVIKIAIVAAIVGILYFALYRPIIRPLLLMYNRPLMPQQEIDAAVTQMRRYWPNNAKMMNLANGLSGDYPIYEFRMLPPNTYSEGMHFLNRMFVNQEAVENRSSLVWCV